MIANYHKGFQVEKESSSVLCGSVNNGASHK